MKKIALVLLALLVLLVGASCGKTETAVDETAAETVAAQPQTAADWLEMLAEKVPFDDTMKSMPERAAAVYGILDEDGYTGDCALFISTNATPEEIAVFRADDALSTDELTALALARLERQKESFTDYAPAEMPKLESAVVRTCGDFVIVCVCADNAKAEALLAPYAS